jgi:hypothetical protein
VVGMVAFSCFSSIGMINFAAKQRWRATALVFAPDRGSQVRIRLTAGANGIRTAGPSRETVCRAASRISVPTPGRRMASSHRKPD